MTKAVARLQGTDVPDSFEAMERFAIRLAQSKMLPRHLMDDDASIFSIMLAARSLDIPMWSATQQIIVQKGRTSMTASLMQSLVIRAGHNMFLVRKDDESATVRSFRKGIGEDECGFADTSFSIEDALKAKLLVRTDKGALIARSQSGEALPWEKYTEDMLIWRAISRAARRYFPDVLMGMNYTPEELGADINEDGEFSGSVVLIDDDAADPEIEKLALQIAACESRKDLRVLHASAKKRAQLGLRVKGVSIEERLNLRLVDLPVDVVDVPVPAETDDQASTGSDTPDETPDPAQAESEPKVDTPSEQGIEQNETEDPAPVVDPDDDGSARVTGLGSGKPYGLPLDETEGDDGSEDDDWAAMVANADVPPASKPIEADPEDERKNTARRRGTVTALTEQMQTMELDANEILTNRFGLSIEEIATSRLAEFLLELKRGGADA